VPAVAQLTRKASFGAVDLAARTVPVVVSTGAPVKRWDGWEVLDLARVDLSRGDLPLIEGHDAIRVNIGQVRRLRVEAGALRGDAVFGMSARADELLADVQAGIVTGVSIGYAYTDTGTPVQMRDGSPGLSFGFQPHEVSIVSVPADIGAGFNRSHPGGLMPTTATTTAPQEAEIRALCRSLPEGFADALIATGATIEKARAAVLTELARRDTAAGGHLNVRSSYLERTVTADAASQMVDALAARLNVRNIDLSGNSYRHSRLSDMARDCLERANVRTGGMSVDQLVKRAMTTSDFPELLMGTGNRVLAQRYSTFTGGLRKIARQTTIRDFRAKSVLRLGEAPALLRVNEHGEFKYGARAESKESYQLRTYGRIFSLSRQAIVNDDLGAFEDMISAFAQSAYNLENELLISLLTSNSAAGPTMQDGVALFHAASHGNLATGGGSALQLSSLATARKALRLMKGLDGTTPVDLTPRYLVVPAALEQTALQLTSTGYQPAVTTEINTAGQALEVVVDPRLDAISTTAWYLAASPEFGTVEYAYLEGAEGPQVDSELGFDVDGVSYRCKLDFGCGIVDWRGLYRAVGA
jgi:hypothetical protein